MKKMLAFLTAAAMAFAVTACGEGSETIERKKSDKKKGASLEVDLSLAYISEPPSAKSRNISPVAETSEGVLLAQSSANYRVRLTFWNAQTNEFTEVERPNPEMYCTSPKVFQLSGERVGVLFEARWVRKWESDAAAVIEVYDKQLQYLETIEIPAFDGDEQMHFCADYSTGTDYLLFEYCYNEEGVMKLEAYNLETGEVKDIAGEGSLVSGASGAVYCYTYVKDHYLLSRVNVQTGRLEEIKFENGFSADFSYEFTTGSGEYEIYAYNNERITGLKLAGNSGETETVLDMAASDLLNEWSDGVYVTACPDGRFFIRNKEDLWLCRKRTEEELQDIQPITLAGVSLNGDLKKIIITYNRSHPEYHIFMVDYADKVNENYVNYDDFIYTNIGGGKPTLYGVSQSDPDNVIPAAVELFRQDLLNGIVPDIICTDNLPYAQFANKGLFLDMKPMMEQDERFNPDDYLMNFFNSMQYQGQQQTIAFSFYVNTIVGETAFSDSKTGRTTDEYQRLLRSVPEGKTGFGYTKESYRDDFLTWMQNGFLNTEAKTCSFDSPAFASLLEIGNSLLTEEEWWKKIEDEGGYSLGTSDFERNAMLTVRSFAQAANYHECLAGEHDYQEITLVGFPSADGNGGMFSAPYQLAINAMSAYPEEIWDIFMSLLSEEVQRSYDVKNYYRSFPVLRSALQEDLEVVTKGANRTFIDRDGYERSIGAITMEEQEFLLDYMEHITAFYYADPTVSTIIQEEADKYFAGDQTAQEAAGMIQSRASLYLSEQY